MEVQKPQQYSAVITKKKQLTKQVYHLFFQLESPSELRFIPGQYATFIIDKALRRQYSICSDPHNVHMFEIVIDTTPMGPGSKYFIESNVGERVAFLAPLGNFHLEDTPTKKVLVATGTGIAPFRSMMLGDIKRLRDKETEKLKDLEISKSPNLQISSPMFLYWGLRYEDDIYWDDEFKGLTGQLRSSQYFLCLSKPSENWQGLKGHVTDYVFQNSSFVKTSEDKEKKPENCEFYLCGNKNMIQELTTKLSAQNVKKEQIKSDLFY